MIDVHPMFDGDGLAVRPDDEEVYRQLDGVAISTAKEFNARLQEWERFYNDDRSHGGLNGQTPYERLRERLQPARHG